MKAILVTTDRKVQITDVPKPVLKSDHDVLIRITSAGICKADLEIIEGIHPFAKPGNIIGHEFGGIVEEIGKNVTTLSPGDKVTVDPVCACGHCHSCKIGKPNVCRNLKTMGVHKNGGFCEYVTVDASQVYRFQNQQISETLLGVAEPYSIGAQNNQRASVSKQDTVLILGAGAIGLCALQDAHRRGARTIITDMIEKRLLLASKMGADVCICVKDRDPFEAIIAETDGNGPDVIINTAGYPHSVEDSLKWIAYGGRIVIVGLSTSPSMISQAEMVQKEVSLFGSRLSTRLFGYVTEGFDNGSYQPELLVTHRFPAERFEDALAQIRNHPDETARVVLTF